MTDTVLIVGSGPVGLTLALELARYRVPVRLIDQMTQRSDKSRAVSLWSRTLELFDRAGVTTDLIVKGNPVRAGNILAGGKPIAHLDFTDVDTPYPFSLMLPQCDTEAILEEKLNAFGVYSELGVELTEFEQNGTGVSATLRRPDGAHETRHFGWMVGCDGAHSSIRHKLGFSFDGDTMPNDWALGDFHMTGSQFQLDELATYWHPDGLIVFFPMGPGRFRVIANLGPSTGSAPAVPTLDEFQAIVDRRGPGSLRLTDSLWTTAFRINERQVNDYRSGRVFLAGDAAHVHSPAGGQGMNTGIQDAINLGWKLAMVCREIAAAPELLDSYTPERRPVGAAVIESAGQLTKVATIQNHALQHIRNLALHVLLGLPQVRKAIENAMTEVSFGYPHSPLTGRATGTAFTAGQRVAPIAGEAPYGAGDTPRFAIRASASDAAEIIGRHPGLVEASARPPRQPSGIELVRPDGYLAMATPNGDWMSVVAYLERLRPKDI